MAYLACIFAHSHYTCSAPICDPCLSRSFGWKDTNPLDPSTFFRNTDQFRCTDNWCYALLATWAVLFIAGCIVQV